MRKIPLTILLMSMLWSIAFADELEVVAGFDSEKDLPVLNEVLRQKDSEIKALDDRITTLEAVVTPSAATQAQMETATSATTYVSPGRTQYHPGTCKGFVLFNGAGSNPTALATYNASSTITRNGPGDWTVTWDTDFSSANYVVSFSGQATGGQTDFFFYVVTKAVGSIRFVSKINGLGASDSVDGISVIAFGDQ